MMRKLQPRLAAHPAADEARIVERSRRVLVTATIQ